MSKEGENQRLVFDTKVIVSFGIGRLHFVQAAAAIKDCGIDVTCLQGWVPGEIIRDQWLDRLGIAVGSPNLSIGMKKRQLPFLAPTKNIGLAWPEFLTQFLFQLSKRFGLSRGVAASIGWRMFGFASKRFLGGQDIFHVRSGAGRGGAIARARQLGIVTLTDHSIAHPIFLQKQLQSEYEETGLRFWLSPTDRFWAMIVKDCEEADLLLVNSDFVKETFVEEGFSAEKIAVAYLGVREDFFSLKKDYSIGNRPLQILFTGQFGIRKGARYVIAALEDLAADGVDFQFTALGDATEAAELVAASPIADRVRLAGFLPQDELKSYLASADIYLFPSLAEGCASSAMEAMAAGLPIVTTRETGLPAKHNENAWIIPSKDASAIADAIRHLAHDEVARRQLGVAAAEMISSRFKWSDYGRNVGAIYNRVHGERGLSAPEEYDPS